jgi:mRNA-degrading endonuclease RelE of RelBE toxin-antitoxin system
MRHWRILLWVIIVETKAFTARITSLLSEDHYRSLQLALLERPTAGSVVPGTGGLRKLRWGASGRGKRGGVRVIYFWHPASTTLLMLFAFSKNEREDLTPVQRQALRKIVETEYP